MTMVMILVSAHKTSVFVAQRIIMKFLAREGVKPAKLFKRLTVQVKGETFKISSVPGTSNARMVASMLRMKAIMIASARQLLKVDRRLPVGISYGHGHDI